MTRFKSKYFREKEILKEFAVDLQYKCNIVLVLSILERPVAVRTLHRNWSRLMNTARSSFRNKVVKKIQTSFKKSLKTTWHQSNSAQYFMVYLFLCYEKSVKCQKQSGATFRMEFSHEIPADLRIKNRICVLNFVGFSYFCWHNRSIIGRRIRYAYACKR